MVSDRKLVKYLRTLTIILLCANFVLSPSRALAIDLIVEKGGKKAVKEALKQPAVAVAVGLAGSQPGKKIISQAFTTVRSKPAQAFANAIVCLSYSYIPVAGVTASSTMCLPCALLTSKNIT
jgi:hypothetical protein